MLITFISQCEKKAKKRSRRVLDTFANRIGDDAWQTTITQDGLLDVRKLLSKTASKNTAVSCHRHRGRRTSELLWVVGRRDRFDKRGRVPVHATGMATFYRDDMKDWHYLPLIRALAVMAALLHDWGKANTRFQKKLKKEFKGNRSDPLRHEWVSCLLLKAFIETTEGDDDVAWLDSLSAGKIPEQAIVQTPLADLNNPLDGLPPIAQLMAWLIVTHHRLPILPYNADDKKEGARCNGLSSALAQIDAKWGYENLEAGTIEQCLEFPQGLMVESDKWLNKIKRWSATLLRHRDAVNELIDNGGYRLILHHARLCLMLGDHQYSSLDKEESKKWQASSKLIANTDMKNDGEPKQYLDQHLVGVSETACEVSNLLPGIERRLPRSEMVRELKKRSGGAFAWQDKAMTRVQQWRTEAADQRIGFFGVNMASTGCGKTYANAKVMLAASEDESLRYILALGLRTLTMQTGDEYRKRIFKQSDGSDLAVIIGSKAVSRLHAQASNQKGEIINESSGSLSAESLLPNGLDVLYEAAYDTLLNTQFKGSKKQKALLYAPVLACTIDHMMAATETVRGGRYILPALRLLSSDLVIDEIDDFAEEDSIAIGRLIHLAGMLGRKVLISSATIPPAMAEGYFNAYAEGWRLFAKTRTARNEIASVWVDEDNTELEVIALDSIDSAIARYKQEHRAFIDKRLACLAKKEARRKAVLIDCQQILNDNPVTESEFILKKFDAYSALMLQTAIQFHDAHSTQHESSGLSISFGVIRMSNIKTCVALAKYLLACSMPDGTELRLMVYHSQQILLMRHDQEQQLDSVLKRNKDKAEDDPSAWDDPIIAYHIEQAAKRRTKGGRLIFVVVATPVEEIGRDHDFDWAILEPSSYRSIVQMAGRVRRHRKGEVDAPNVGILQYNWRTLELGEAKEGERVARFYWPGYENRHKKFVSKGIPWQLKTHDVYKLLDVDVISERLDASARIRPPLNDAKELTVPLLALLEHVVIEHQLAKYDAYGPETMQGYLQGGWFLTALPQLHNKFRRSHEIIRLFGVFSQQDSFYFTEKNSYGNSEETAADELRNQNDAYRIKIARLQESFRSRLWLERDYHGLLQLQAEKERKNDTNEIDERVAVKTAALVYGEISFEHFEDKLYYNDQLGLYRSIGGDDG